MYHPARILSFDLDETLWPCREVIARAESALHGWLDRHYPRITAEFDVAAMRAVRVRMADDRPDLAADLTALRAAALHWHVERAGYPPEVTEAAMEVFLAERNRVTPFEEVPEVLERLGAHYPLVAVTNGNADISRTPLAGIFDLALSAADVGAQKPDPAMFRAVCRELGVPASNLLHVGDDPVRDVQAARDFGAQAVWVNRDGAPWPEELVEAHHELTSLHGLPALLLGKPA
ncbi:HAD family hydrolase [Thiohalorhabdus sp. Cl-TMA]|uniref:HAD family hydrolase n=1 Tax=Thiohalorhabdus methylotrophus TaxID=3242694 RepID=A0ABV4TZZ4_9GAMM